MRIALIADPHLSMLDRDHCGMNLGVTQCVTEALIEDVQRRQPGLVVWMGDLTHEGSAEVRSRFAELHARLMVTSVQFSGNHDVEHIDKAEFARQSVPCVRRQWWQAAGWNLVVLDTVRELSPDNPNGELSEFDLRFLGDVARQASGPMLVMGHHPLRQRCLDTEAFRRAVEPFTGTGVYIGAHTHVDRYETVGNWHLLELAGCCCEPFGYHMAELSSRAIAIEPIPVEVEVPVPDGNAGHHANESEKLAEDAVGDGLANAQSRADATFPLRLVV